MTQSHRPFDAPQPAPIDDNEDRMGSVEPLDFDDDGEPSGKIGDAIPERELAHDLPAKRVREAGMTGASTADHHSTDDDLSPEVLIHEDGARSATEPGGDEAKDWDLSVVDEDDIGGGDGLDEAELARQDPLDGKR